MRMTFEQEKKLADDARLLRSWKTWHRERTSALLAGPYGAQAQALIDFFKVMNSPSELVEFVKRGPWRGADEDVRYEILALVDAVIIRKRDRTGLAPFDDALPFTNAPPNAFLILREFLFPSDDGANWGAAQSKQAQTLNHQESQSTWQTNS
jgi:hypothetical protein